ncbi:MAG: ABC-2 family transporter protein [Anaerolineaceae bacterium]|nr:ABC-2 family transporter protein [Anaerolineaceae bacterium]
MYYLKLIRSFMRASLQQDLAYRANFWINLLHSLLNLVVALAAILILFNQINDLNGWTFSATVGVMAVYLIIGALRGLFIGPSLETLVGMGQEVWNGNFDFSLIRPVNIQFLVTFRIWRFFSLLDLALGVGVLFYSVSQSPDPLTWLNWFLFAITLAAGTLIIYALLLGLSALAFWSPGFLITWVFDALFQLARYPIGIYPPFIRILLTWIIPIGLITTIPAQAISGQIGSGMAFTSLGAAVLLLIAASWLFRSGIRRYHSASS